MGDFIASMLRAVAFSTALVVLSQNYVWAEDEATPAAADPEAAVAGEPVASASKEVGVEEKKAEPVEAPAIIKPRPLFQHASYPAAWKAAQDSNRPILVFVCMPNCHYCVKMKQQVYLEPRVKDLVSNSFESIKADRYAHAKLISSLKIRLYPTTVLVGPNNKILDVIEGYSDANRFQQRLQTGLASVSNLTSTTATR